jgi:hypothetical protein
MVTTRRAVVGRCVASFRRLVISSLLCIDNKVCCCCCQVKRCKTDSFANLEWDNAERPEATNLLTLYQLSTGKTKVRHCPTTTCIELVAFEGLHRAKCGELLSPSWTAQALYQLSTGKTQGTGRQK